MDLLFSLSSTFLSLFVLSFKFVRVSYLSNVSEFSPALVRRGKSGRVNECFRLDQEKDQDVPKVGHAVIIGTKTTRGDLARDPSTDLPYYLTL